MFRNLLHFFAMALIALCCLGASELSADDIADAVQILDARNGTIRKWSHTPEVVIVHDRPVNQQAIDETIEFINDETGLNIGPPKTIDLTDSVLSDRFYRKSTFRPKQLENGNVEVTVTIAAKEDFAAKGNLIVFMLEAPFASHMMIASGYGSGSNALERQYLRSPSHCFFEIRSNDKSIQFGRVFISSELDMKKQASCIYEELTQTMGLVDDAVGSEVFTYDNTAEDKPRDHDRRLLAALYDPSVVYGDPVAKVVVLYALSAPR